MSHNLKLTYKKFQDQGGGKKRILRDEEDHKMKTIKY
jgi:nitrogen fixation-related uncharacterized protein